MLTEIYVEVDDILQLEAEKIREGLKVSGLLTKDLFGWFFGDKGYMLNDEKRELLERNGQLRFFTKVRKNMKEQELELQPKLWLNKNSAH